MQSNPTLKGTARRIAEAIVELVEDADGPVTLYRLDQEIPGFAKQDPPSWSHMLFGDEKFIWSGMTKAGHIALGYVLRERRVAVQFVNSFLYAVEGCVIKDENWFPTLLLPASAANLESPACLLRTSQAYRDFVIQQAHAHGLSGNRLLSPRPVRFTSDQFAV